jgi:hypothetical protein
MVEYKVRFNKSARTAIAEARNWYRQISPVLANRLNEEVTSVVASVMKSPAAYSIRFESVRRINLIKFPYALFYLIDEEHKWIVFTNFFHVKRDMPYKDQGIPENILHEQ